MKKIILPLIAAAAFAVLDAGETIQTVRAERTAMVNAEAPRRYVGFVEAVRQTDIMPRVTGNLLKIHFREGSSVKEGDLLYELEDTTYRASVAALEAEKQQLEAQLKYAQIEFSRSDTLLKSRAVSVSTHDKAEMEISSARAGIRRIEAQLLDARNTLSYTKIYSPLTGVIGKSVFSEGNLITPQGGKLTDIVMISPIYVRFSLSERVFRRDFGGGKTAQSREIRLLTADGTPFPETAKVKLIDNKVDPATNSVTMWVEFKNADRRLIPGGFVTVLTSPEKGAMRPAVKPSALIAGEKGYTVYVLDKGNRVSVRSVTAGNITPEGLQIIRSGLDGTETVITDGMHKVSPGMTVSPVYPESK